MYELPKLKEDVRKVLGLTWSIWSIITISTRIGILLKSFISYLCFVPKLNIKLLWQTVIHSQQQQKKGRKTHRQKQETGWSRSLPWLGERQVPAGQAASPLNQTDKQTRSVQTPQFSHPPKPMSSQSCGRKASVEDMFRGSLILPHLAQMHFFDLLRSQNSDF